MKDEIKWSHTKLQTILTCPMTYYLNYVQGISIKKKRPALEIGSAVHWGIENNTYDLRHYYQEQNLLLPGGFTSDQLLAQAMDYYYLLRKNDLYKRILVDNETGEILQLQEEIHEGFVTSPMPSNIEDVESHTFLGILDLLIRTNKGLIIIDYKTSTYEPDWNSYLDQLYRYVWLVQNKYPGVPILKIGIINIRKSKLYMRKSETQQEYFTRLCQDYIKNGDKYIDYHEYPANSLDKNMMSDYMDNLYRMVDTAYIIDKNKAWFINYNEAVGKYGKSDYYDIFYKTPQAFTLYKIKDKIWNGLEIVHERECIQLDMEVVENSNILNHYEQFEEVIKTVQDVTKSSIFDACKQNYKTSDKLLEIYWETYKKLQKEAENEKLEN